MFNLLHPDPSQAIILAGSGRSGTTWLGNIMAANPNIRIIFEPFDRRRVPDAASVPLRPYARVGDKHPAWELFVRQVLCGRIHNEWVDQQGKRWWATRCLVKTIRATLLLGWIDHLFHPRIVFMTRHPCAVVLSRVKLKWESHLDVLLAQPQLLTDHLEPFVDLIHGAQTEVQKQAVLWCVENLVPLHQLREHNWVFCTYEQLYRQPQAESERILQAVGICKTPLTQRAIRQVSMVTRPDSALLTQGDPLTDWQRHLSTQDIDSILNIVQQFGITLYTDRVEPDLSSLRVAPQRQSPLSSSGAFTLQKADHR